MSPNRARLAPPYTLILAAACLLAPFGAVAVVTEVLNASSARAACREVGLAWSLRTTAARGAAAERECLARGQR